MIESDLLDGDKALVGQDEGAFRDADLADEALVLGDVLNGDVVDHRRHQLVHVLLGGERVDDIHLLRQPCEHTRLNLRGVSNHHDMALGSQNRAAKLAATLQVLQVAVGYEFPVRNEPMSRPAVSDVVDAGDPRLCVFLRGFQHLSDLVL